MSQQGGLMTLLVFFLVLFASILHAGWNFAAKKAAGDLSVMWLGICLASGLSWPFAAIVWQPEHGSAVASLYVLATGVLHAGYFSLLAKAYSAGDISVVYPVARGTGVAGTAVVALAWLHEPLSGAGGLGIVAICTGTVLLGLGQRRHPDTCMAYISALFVGTTITAYSVVDKLAVGSIHPIAYISGMFTVCAVCLAPYQLWHRRRQCLDAWQRLKTYIGVIGIGSMCTYMMILFAFRLGPVSYIVAVREFAVVIGALLGFVFLEENVTMRKAAGILTIVCGLVLVKMA